MSVFTLLFFLPPLFPSVAVCAPNQRTDKLSNCVQAQIHSHQSIESVYTATATPAAVSSYPSNIEVIPSFPPDSSSSTLGAERSELEPPLTTVSVTSFGPISSSAPDASCTGMIRGSAVGSVLQSYTIQGAQPTPSGTGKVGGAWASGGVPPCPGSDAPYSNSTSTSQKDGVGYNGTIGSASISPLASTAGLVVPMASASNSGAAGCQANESPIRTAGTDRSSDLAAININTIPIYSPHPAGTPIPLQVSLYQIVGSVAPPSSATSTTTQTPPPSSSGTNSPCVNNTTIQNMTADYASVNPYSDFGPLIYFGLNYTTFFLTSYPAPNHIATAPESHPKTIAAASPHVSFTLYTLSLFCASSSPIIGNCTVSMYGLGHSGPGNSGFGSIQSITLFEDKERVITFAEDWRNLSEVTFRAMNGNVTLGVALRAAEYAVTSFC